MQHVESNTDAFHDVDLKTSQDHVEEVAIARITDEALFELSAESLKWRSWTGFRICLVMFVQGCIMAGYGIDWCVIGGINNFDVRIARIPITGDREGCRRIIHKTFT
jgi:hypothetical protein